MVGGKAAGHIAEQLGFESLGSSLSSLWVRTAHGVVVFVVVMGLHHLWRQHLRHHHRSPFLAARVSSLLCQICTACSVLIVVAGSHCSPLCTACSRGVVVVVLGSHSSQHCCCCRHGVASLTAMSSSLSQVRSVCGGAIIVRGLHRSQWQVLRCRCRSPPLAASLSSSSSSQVHSVHGSVVIFVIVRGSHRSW